MTLNEEQIKEIELVEKAVCEFFDVEVGGIYERTSRRKESQARAFVLYILHEDMKISVGCISKKYSRSPNSIFKSLSKIKYRIGKMHMYKEMYLNICNIKNNITFAK